MARAKVYTYDRRIVESDNRLYGILNYDRDNAYPQRVRAKIQDSPRARAVLGVFRRFITGDGFTDKTYWKAKVNAKGLTMDALNRRIDDDAAHHNGAYVHVNFNANMKMVSMTPVPFEHVRLPHDANDEQRGKLAVYDDWPKWKRSSIPKDSIHWLYPFNPDPNFIQNQVDSAQGWSNYRGQLAYLPFDGTARYPLSPFDAAYEDIDTSSQLKVYNNRLVRRDFNPSTVMATYGRSEGDANDIADQVKSFMGAEEAAKFMHLELDSKEQTPDFLNIPQTEGDKRYRNVTEDVRQNIRDVAMVPPVLLGDLIAGKLGTAQEIIDATGYYNWVTLDYRRAKEEFFGMLHQFWHLPKDNPSNDFTIIPVTSIVKVIDNAYLPDLTRNERRVMLGYPELEEKNSEETILAERLQVGGTQALVAVLTNPDLEDEQKVETLKIVFSIPEEDALKMVYGKDGKPKPDAEKKPIVEPAPEPVV